MDIDGMIERMAALKTQAQIFMADLGHMEVLLRNHRDAMDAEGGETASDAPGNNTEGMTEAEAIDHWKGSVKEYLEAQKVARPEFDGEECLKLFQSSHGLGKFSAWGPEEWRRAYDHVRAAIQAGVAVAEARPDEDEPIGPDDWAAFEDEYQDRLAEAAGILHQKFGREKYQLDYPGISIPALKAVSDCLAAWKGYDHPSSMRQVWGWMKNQEFTKKYDLKSTFYAVQREGGPDGRPFPSEFNDYTEDQAGYVLGRLRAVLFFRGLVDSGDTDHMPNDLPGLRQMLIMELGNSIKCQGLAPPDGNIDVATLRAEMKAIHELDPEKYKAILSVKDCRDAELLKLYILAARDRIGAASL